MKIFIIILTLNVCLSLVKGFEEIELEVLFEEEQEDGTLVLDLRNSIDELRNAKTSNGYKIKKINLCSNIYFDEKNQFEIRSKRIDREELCLLDKNCYFNCKILIQKENQMKLIKLKIEIKDKNDHKPTFAKKNYFYSIENKEDLIENEFRIGLEEAKDKDLSFENSIANYHFELNSNEEKQSFPFKLTYDENKHLLELILMNKTFLKDQYHLKLVVNDRQNLSDFCFIEIQLKQKSFSSFRFQSNLYSFAIDNLHKKVIGQVQLENQFQIKDRLFFRLIPKQNLFQINQTNGQIYLIEDQLSSSFDSLYQFHVEVFNSNAISTSTTVQIHFNLSSFDKQEETNSIQILIPKLFQKSTDQIQIQENSSVPLTILQIYLSSSSSSTSIEMKSSFDINQYFQLKQLDQQSFELILVKSFDYENLDETSFHLNLTTNSIGKSIRMSIENINDNSPFFNQNQFQLQIEENNPFPLLFYSFQAIDWDQNLTQIIYQLQFQEEKDKEFFLLNSTNGQFWIQTSFDREVQDLYSFSICSFDQLFQSCSSVSLNILDQNDNVCQFNSSSFIFNIDENLSSQTNLFQINAFDRDYQQNSTLFYSFLNSTEYLTINSSNGLVQTTSFIFDYETIQFYSIDISACDNFYSKPSFCCSTKLILQIQDLNDNLPFLIYPSSTDQIFLINYSNHSLPQLKAFDQDSLPQHRLISFQILDGSLSSLLTIDYYSGQLSFLSFSQPSLPLFGTLLLSISSQTNVTLTLLIFDSQTDPQTYLQSLQSLSSSSSSFSSSFLYSQLFFILLFFFIFFSIICFVFLLFYLFKYRSKQCHFNDPLMNNTPSTTTLSTKSISNSNSTTTNNQKKLYETYYSFGDSYLSPQTIYV